MTIKLTSLLILFLLSLLFISCHKQKDNAQTLRHINAQQIAQSNLSHLQAVDSLEVKRLLITYDNLIEWENKQRQLINIYPGNYLKNNLDYEKQKYLSEFIASHNFYHYPIIIEKQEYNCLLITTKGKYENWLEDMFRLDLFFLNPSDQKPQLLAKHLRFLGIGEFNLNSICDFYTNKEVISKFYSHYCSDDIEVVNGKDIVYCMSDTVIVKMNVDDKMVIKELQRDTIKTEFNR